MLAGMKVNHFRGWY